MGHAIDALIDGVQNVPRNPKILLFSYGLSIAAVPLFAVLGIVAFILALIPIVGSFFARPIMMIPLKTILFGGMLGVVGAGFGGSIGVEDVTDTLKEKGVSLAGAFAIYEAVVVVISIVVAILLLIVIFGGAMSAAAIDSDALAGGVGVGMIVAYVGLLLLFTLVGTLFQFVDVAVVAGDHGAVDAVKESFRLCKDGPLSVLGYTVLRGLLGFVVLLPGYVVMAIGAEFADPLIWSGALFSLLLYPVAFALLMSYHAAYYGHRVRARSSEQRATSAEQRARTR